MNPVVPLRRSLFDAAPGLRRFGDKVRAARKFAANPHLHSQLQPYEDTHV